MPELRLRAEVSDDRRIVLVLPPDFPTGPVEIEVRRPAEEVEIRFDETDLSRLPHCTNPATGEPRLTERSGLVREVRTADQ